MYDQVPARFKHALQSTPIPSFLLHSRFEDARQALKVCRQIAFGREWCAQRLGGRLCCSGLSPDSRQRFLQGSQQHTLLLLQSSKDKTTRTWLESGTGGAGAAAAGLQGSNQVC